MACADALNSALIIGGCGFIGSHLVQRLVQNGSKDVSVLDIDIRNKIDGANYHQADLRSRDSVMSVFKKTLPMTIFHLASPPMHDKDRVLHERVSIEGTRTVLDIALEFNVDVLVYTSTSSVVHDSISDLIEANEAWPILDMPPQTELYAWAKGVTEKMVLAANGSARIHGGHMLTVAIRPAVIFGERDPNLTTKMIETGRDGKYGIQIGDGKKSWNVCHVSNLVDGYLLAAKALLDKERAIKLAPAKRVAGEAFNITGDAEDRIPFWKFGRSLGAAAGYPTDESKIMNLPVALAGFIGSLSEWFVWLTSFGKQQAIFTRYAVLASTIVRTVSIEKAKERLGYQPVVSTSEGIKRAGAWYAGQKGKAP
jgi:sterol-4alpha-carboxylate 3-dehydrogenase (decarboxylating)